MLILEAVFDSGNSLESKNYHISHGLSIKYGIFIELFIEVSLETGFVFRVWRACSLGRGMGFKPPHDRVDGLILLLFINKV
jgi:hypothetical protein